MDRGKLDHITRRGKIWKSLKQHVNRTNLFSARSKESLLADQSPSTAEIRRRQRREEPARIPLSESRSSQLSSSHPNLFADSSTSRRHDHGRNSPSARLKGIMRLTSSSPSVIRRQNRMRDPSPPDSCASSKLSSANGGSRVAFADPPPTCKKARNGSPGSIFSKLRYGKSKRIPAVSITAEITAELGFKEGSHMDGETAVDELTVVADGDGVHTASSDDLNKGSEPADADVDAFVTFLLKVNLKEGRDLVIRDASGSSDPYVKFKYDNTIVYKSNTIFKSLNPTWDEEFSVLIEDPTKPFVIEVFDYDRFALDDFMGSSVINLSHFTFWQAFEEQVMLSEEGGPDDYMGYLNVEFTIEPQTMNQKDEFAKKSRGGNELKKPPVKGLQMWSSTMNVILVKAKNLLPTEPKGAGASYDGTILPDPYVKFKLGTEKYKSKVLTRTLSPKWLEQFDLHVFEEHQKQLQMMVLDKRTSLFMGSIDLDQLEAESSHERWFDLEDGAGSVLLLISITGTTGADSVSDLSSFDCGPKHLDDIASKYSPQKSFDEIKDVGSLIVKVFKAQNLAAADIGGKSDPFCVLELVNTRLQTPTEYKTLNPEWNKIFTFNVKDIHTALDVTIFDEDPNKKTEFLGRVSIPLLKIRNGEKRWYALKDRKFRTRAKGQVLLELFVVYNHVRAAIRTVNPREQKFLFVREKFKRHVFMNNVNRIRTYITVVTDVADFMVSCFSWESKSRTIIAFGSFLTITYCFELYLLPLCLLLLFAKFYVYRTIEERVMSKKHSNEIPESFLDDVDEADEDIIDEKVETEVKCFSV